jgi:hypothetical protein
MPRRRQSITQRELTRAIKATVAAGIRADYEVDTERKTIRIIPNGGPVKIAGPVPTDTPDSIIKQL